MTENERSVNPLVDPENREALRDLFDLLARKDELRSPVTILSHSDIAKLKRAIAIIDDLVDYLDEVNA